MNASPEGGRSEASAAGMRDPRTEVTPDAFGISPELLGLPLAGPWSRFTALVVDGILIAVLSRAGLLLLGVAAAIFFLRIATSRERGDYLARAFRGAVGCLGIGILLVTGCGLFVLLAPDGEDGEGLLSGIPMGQIQSVDGEGEVSVSLGDVFSGLSDVRAYRDAETAEDAARAAARVARRFEAAGAPEADVSEALREMAPEDAPWSGEVDRIVERALFEADSAPVPSEAGPDEASDTPREPTAREPEGLGAGAPLGEEAPSAADPDSLSLPEALDRYAVLLSDSAAPRGSPAAGQDAASEERARLRSRIVAALGADTLALLREQLEEEASDRATVEEALERTRQELRDVREAGILGWVSRLVDDLGIAFGWGAIYMTVFMTWWNGQTPGKRLLRIRVRQLDGTPLSWWESFERAGGYAAGFATGLLGFVQVFWDPNRQAIHDKIAETVVTSERRSGTPKEGPAGELDASPAASPPSS